MPPKINDQHAVTIPETHLPPSDAGVPADTNTPEYHQDYAKLVTLRRGGKRRSGKIRGNILDVIWLFFDPEFVRRKYSR